MTRQSGALAVALAIFGAALVVNSAQAQREGPPRGPRRGGPMMMGQPGGSLLGLLRNEQVRKELELVDEQKEKLRAISEELTAEMRDQWAGLRDLDRAQRGERMQKIREKNRERMAEIQKEIGRVLLPHQAERLRQIGLQLRLRSQDPGAFDSPELAEALGVTEEQKKELRRIRDEAREKLRNLPRQIMEEARAKVMEILTPDQRGKLEKMQGEKFELDRSRMWPRGGRRNGPRPSADK